MENRVIKFRAWTGEKMITPACVGEFGEWYETGRDYENGRGDKEGLMQYTGIKDSYGAPIYEGDILKYTRTKWRCHDHPKNGKDMINKCVVYWDEKECGFREDMFDDNNRIFSSGSLVFEDDRAKENILQIIGNIYQHPHLLIQQS